MKMRVPMVVDTSAWARLGRPKAAAYWQEANDAGLLAACPVATLEILRVTRNEDEFRALDSNFAALPQAPVTATVCAAALSASRKLGARRRLPVPDYLIAAAASERGFAVLHADKHFDLLTTVLPFESVRLPA